MINCQVMEAGKNTSNALDAFNRFFHEACVPKVFFIDKDGAMMKCLSEAELDIVSTDGSIAKEKGIAFETCSAQGHNAHGRIERKIKLVQEAFDRSELKKFKLHGLGWQTLAKSVEHQVNSIPLGYLTHREDNASVLRILTPNFLKLNAAANRSPGTLFTLPKSGKDLMSRVEEAYKLFYEVWNNAYVPLIAKRQIWHQEHENLIEGDVIYFKLTDSAMSSKWLIGKIEAVKSSKDGKVRRVIVGYKYSTEDGERDFRSVERPVRDCVKLCNIEDTSIFEDIQQVREACKVILEEDEESKPLMSTSNTSSTYRKPVITVACNTFMSSDNIPVYNAVNFGSFIRNEQNRDSCEILCHNCEIGLYERNLGISNEESDVFFMIDYDMNYDDNLVLI